MRVRKRLDFLVKNRPTPPSYRLKFLTLTIKSQKELAPMIRELNASFRKLRQRGLWKKTVDGGAFVIEVKYSDAGWHAHLHAIINARFIPYFNLLKLWQKVSSGRGVFIKDVPSEAVVRYLTKYLSKPDLPDSVLADISEGLRGIRLFAPFGSWHKLNLKYIKPVCPCKTCGGTHWSDLDVMNGDYTRTRCKDFPSGFVTSPAP